MGTTEGDVWLAGVDGCSEGWIAAFVRPEGDEVHIESPKKSFSEIVDLIKPPGIVAVDMPIGLPLRSPEKGRLAERSIRPLLGKRKSSVFRVPSRAAVYASVEPERGNAGERFVEASRIARDTSDDKKGFSIQAFHIFPKIVEIDSLLCKRKELTLRIFEVHPELAFWRLNGNTPLDLPKKIRGRPNKPGLDFRRSLLVKEGLDPAGVYATAPRGAADDDLVDALACAAIARRIFADKACPFPNPPDRGSCDIPIAIWA